MRRFSGPDSRDPVGRVGKVRATVLANCSSSCCQRAGQEAASFWSRALQHGTAGHTWLFTCECMSQAYVRFETGSSAVLATVPAQLGTTLLDRAGNEQLPGHRRF